MTSPATPSEEHHLESWLERSAVAKEGVPQVLGEGITALLLQKGIILSPAASNICTTSVLPNKAASCKALPFSVCKLNEKQHEARQWGMVMEERFRRLQKQ